MSEEIVQETAQNKESDQQLGQDQTLLHEVMAKKEKIQSLSAKNDELTAEIEAMKNLKLEQDGNLQELVDNLKTDNNSLKENADKWVTYESDTRKSLLDKIPEDKREKWAKAEIPILKDYVETINASQPKNIDHIPNAARVQNAEFGGYASMQEYAMKNPKGCDEHLTETVKGYQWGKVK